MFKTSMLDTGHLNCDNYKLMKQAGFDSVMLGWRDVDRREKPDKARNVGLLIENIHAPFRNADSIWLDNMDGDDYTESLLKSIDDCKDFDIPTMVVHINNEYQLPPMSNIGIERLKRITEKAENKNINIAFENTYAPNHIQFIFNSIFSKKLGFCFDSGHHNYMTPGRDLLDEFGERLMAMHLNDNFGADYINAQNPVYKKGTKEWGIQVDLHLLPFDGNIDWNKIIMQLKKIKYKGAIAFEVGVYKNCVPEMFFEMAFSRAKKLLDMMNKKETM